MPRAGLSHLLDHGVAFAEQVGHVGGEEKAVSEKAERAKGGGVVKNIGHERLLPFLAEEVIVIEALESPTYHAVAKLVRPFKAGDLASEGLPEAKMFGPPRHTFAKPDEATGHSSDGLFAATAEGVLVQIYGAGEVENALDGCVNGRL